MSVDILQLTVDNFLFFSQWFIGSEAIWLRFNPSIRMLKTNGTLVNSNLL